MAPLTKTVVLAMASSSSSSAATTVAAGLGGACLADPPVLLQTHRAMGKSQAEDLVLEPQYTAPSYVAPPDATSNVQAQPSQQEKQQKQQKANDVPNCGGGSGGCTDSQSACSRFAEQGFCEAGSQYEAWMADNCKLSCGLCGGGDSGTGGSGNGSCVDGDSHCSHWAQSGYCEDGNAHAAYMRNNCRLSCGICG